MMDHQQRILLLDGISGVPLGRELAEAFESCNFKVEYTAFNHLPKRWAYGLRSKFWKAFNKAAKEDEFYHFPKVSDRTITSLIKRLKPDIVLVVGFSYRFINPSLLKQLKLHHSFSLFLYDTDSCNLYSKRREFLYFMRQELTVYDRIFSFSKVTTQLFKNTLNLDAHFLPFGAKPLNRPQSPSKSMDVLFVGSGDLRRILLLENIKENLTIYGARWERNYALMSHGLRQTIHNQEIWGEALYQRLDAAKIVLNITRTDFYGAGTGVNLRIFEALAAGCFLLTDYTEELEDLFEIGEEIEVFRSPSELVSKVQYYLENDEARERIARNGHAKFMQSFTWKSRAELMTRLFQQPQAGN